MNSKLSPTAVIPGCVAKFSNIAGYSVINLAVSESAASCAAVTASVADSTVTLPSSPARGLIVSSVGPGTDGGLSITPPLLAAFGLAISLTNLTSLPPPI